MTTKESEAQFVDTANLRIGMFVYLDLGWMKHSFALNSFKIASQQQIDTILKLGINRIRWSPEKSDPEPIPGLPPADSIRNLTPRLREVRIRIRLMTIDR